VSGDCGKLTKEPFAALWSTCYGIDVVTDACLSELWLNYVLLGSFRQIASRHVFFNIANFLVESTIFSYKLLKTRKTSLTFYSEAETCRKVHDFDKLCF